MSKQQAITTISFEQQVLIDAYRDRWISIDVSTDPVDYAKGVEVIKNAYLASSYPVPEVLYYPSPFAAIKDIVFDKGLYQCLGKSIQTKFSKRVLGCLENSLRQQFNQELLIRLHKQIQFSDLSSKWNTEVCQISYFSPSILKCIEGQLLSDLEELGSKSEDIDISFFTRNLYRPAQSAISACMIDFCISVLQLHFDKIKWDTFKDVIQSCGLLLMFERVCILCDRPSKMCFDENNELHAEGSPSLQFSDGYSVYSRHGKSDNANFVSTWRV